MAPIMAESGEPYSDQATECPKSHAGHGKAVVRQIVELQDRGQEYRLRSDIRPDNFLL